ncbi:hypothetical protein GQ55_3G349900 [Panicum hallii var. hallii]|uniref:Cathepsin propeptide inhibitor domain-containing protein n=1 Tax=Panicum hallii var. hallii TaxID=1504633 RepID=A0A2T7EFT2_9POAL|nr:hypothetical protein GQ55_3G349900 [Panicum hallii var. hallii]
MARLHLHRPSLLPICFLLLAAAAAAEEPERKVRMTVRYAEEEEARWLDRWAETHQPLGSSGGRFTVKRATEEESAWLDRLSGAAKGAREARDGKDGGDRQSVEFDHDDPRGRVVQAFLARLARLREDLESSKAEEQVDLI